MGKLEYVYLLHILFVAPFLIFSGYIGMNECSEEKKIVFKLLLSLGVLVFVYHGHSYFKIRLLKK